MGTRRCSICNTTNNKFIAEQTGAVFTTEKFFKKDPNDETGYLCLTCHEEIMEALMEMYLDDDDKETEEENDLEIKEELYG